MPSDRSFPRPPVGTVINGVTWDGSQWRWGGDICVPDPRLFLPPTPAEDQPDGQPST